MTILDQYGRPLRRSIGFVPRIIVESSREPIVDCVGYIEISNPTPQTDDDCKEPKEPAE